MSTLKVNTINAATSGQAVAVDIQNPRSFRNLIMNGAMTVAQRGTSITTGTGNFDKYTLDGWKVATHSTDQLNLTVTQEAMGTALPGFASYIKVSPNVAESANDSDEYTFLRHSIEAQDLQHLAYGTSSAKSLTLSFWVKSNTAGTASITFEKHDAPAYYITRTYTINTSDTWEKKTVTIPGLTASVINNDNGQGLNIYWFLSAGTGPQSVDLTSWSTYSNDDWIYGHAINLTDSTSDYLALTGVQLEVGSYATDFENTPKSYELARCQRYLYIEKADNGDYMGLNGLVTTDAAVNANRTLPVPMRAIPSYTGTETDLEFQSYDTTAMKHFDDGIVYRTPTTISCTVINLKWEVSSTTAGHFAMCRCKEDGAQMIFSAEL